MKSLIKAFLAKIKIQPKSPKKKFNEFIDYEFIYLPDEESTAVELTSGAFSSVIFQYFNVKLLEEGENPKLKFQYDIIDSGTHDMDDLKNSQEFVTILGDLLTELIIDNEQTRTDNPKEPDLQREFHS
jgi:hypothetical protein